MNEGISYDLELPFVTAKGKHLWVRALGEPVIKDEQVVRVRGSFQDITEKKKNEIRLQESEKKYRNLIETAQEGIWVINVHNDTTLANPFMAKMLGYEVSEMMGQSLLFFMDEPSIEISKENIERRKQGITEAYELELVHKDGTIVHTTMATSPIEDQHGNYAGFLACVSDITDLKKFNSELIASKEIAEQANQAKSRFLATMSHEIRTPLNGVLGTAELLAKTKLNPDQEKYVQLLVKSGKHLVYVINDILDYSKLEADKLILEENPFDPKECVQEIVDVMKGVANDKHIELISVIDHEVPSLVLGDSIRLKQVINNLLSNAIKFTEVGDISVTLRVKSHHSPNIELLFSVKDPGIGISQEKISNLFEEFSQVDSSISRSKEGTGLGLAISKRLVHLMGGKIGVDSQEGVGSDFYFTVPLIENHVIQMASSNQSNTSEQENKPLQLNILVVEDNKVNQIIAVDMLEELGHTADIVSNGKEALAKLEEIENGYDLILMDIHMPIMDGLTTANHIIKKYPRESRPPIIALTADAMSSEKERYLEAGMDDYMAKPFALPDLEAMINKYSNFFHKPKS